MKNTAARKLKQVPEGYLIRIDPHKKKHAAVAITQDFTTRDKFKFDNTREVSYAYQPQVFNEIAAMENHTVTGNVVIAYLFMNNVFLQNIG